VASAAQGVPSRLAWAIDRCLAKDPAHRFAGDDELAVALGQALPERRELPVALRLFVKREGRIGPGGVLLYLWVLGAISMLAGQIAGFAGLGSAAGWGIFFGGLTLVPAGIILNRARRLLKSGYGHEELAVAFKAEVERAKEEGAFEYGHKPSLYERVVRVISAGGLSVAALSAIGLAVIPGSGPEALVTTLASSLTIGLGGSTLALLRLQRRRGIDAQLRSWIWKSRLARWVFDIAGLGLGRVQGTGAATYRPTELAIGMAADRLFEDLPRELRRALSDLPDVVRKLESDAQKMRLRVEELNGVLAEVGSIRPESRALREALPPADGSDVTQQRDKLKEDLLVARDATQQRLAGAVAALETIRLGLLRMQGGAGSVESLTDDLAVARDVADDIDRLLDGQREVRSILEGEA
jgi:serine/threonine-protein kinase